MKDITLVIMAAGMGSRYGGLKQIDPVGLKGEIILDYSVYDAIEAGFTKVIFVIKHEIEEDFKAIIGNKYDGRIKIDFAYQDIDNIPEGYSVPEGRTKPWGTGHAILSCKDLVDGPFAVINADDFYGKDTFKKLYNELTREKPASDKYQFCMAGFKIENTLTENGHVARGVCETEGNRLTGVNERTKIVKDGDKIKYTEDDGESWTEIPVGTTVSMNLWGFTADMMKELQKGFAEFFEKNKNDLSKCEYYIPFAVDDLIKEGKAEVTVVVTEEKWYGVTYKADKPVVEKALKEKTEEGVYPSPLFA
ncbi:MAG: nucleotidyltransferase [Clostridia bacterium]|nr:nucleotidyltransferase [Clostridia bacterium]